jgi:iron complex outermembrane receptor protein
LPYTQNAAEGAARGFELEMQAAFGSLELNMGVAYLDAEFSKAVQLNLSERVDPRIPLAQLPPGHVSNSVRNRLVTVDDGQVLPFSPEVTGNIGVQYNFKIGNGKLTPRVQYSYLDKQFATPFKASDYQYGDLTTVPSRSIIDLRVTYEPVDTLRFEAFATNILDETYIAAQVQDSTTAFGGIQYGAPRQVGIRGVFKFN